jgi:hypothetical protein
MGTSTTEMQSRRITLQKEGQSSGRVVLPSDGRSPGQPHGEVSLARGSLQIYIMMHWSRRICSMQYDLDGHHV